METRAADRVLLVSLILTSPAASPTPTRRRVTAAQQARAAALLSHNPPVDEAEDGDDASDLAADSPVSAEDRFVESMIEFRELTESAGGRIVGEVAQRRGRPDAATLIGKGKVEELSATVKATNADVVLFDHDLSPTQLRNLEDALSCRVLDRTQLILDIFACHARTREGHLQVELAQLEYMLPRLTGRGHAMSQTGGGIGTRGPGETRLETDRRRIQRRLVQLRKDLEAVRQVRRQQRQRRESVPVPTIALVGYTNAGKSTLFNALTQAGVLESSQMFATLDPKLKAILMPSRRKVLLSDTVGFIRDLPHTLVTSFRATLEQVQRAEVLVHVQDASSALRDTQKQEVEKVLQELDVLGKPRLEVFNKLDRLSERERGVMDVLPGVIGISALTGEGLEILLERMDQALLEDAVVERSMLVPQNEGRTLAALESGAMIHEREYESNHVRMRVSGPSSLLGRYRKFWVTSQGD